MMIGVEKYIKRFIKKRENHKREICRAEMRRRDKVLKDTRGKGIVFYREKKII